jgi:hypothetical protein
MNYQSKKIGKIWELITKEALNNAMIQIKLVKKLSASPKNPKTTPVFIWITNEQY